MDLNCCQSNPKYWSSSIIFKWWEHSRRGCILSSQRDIPPNIQAKDLSPTSQSIAMWLGMLKGISQGSLLILQ